MFNTLPLVSRDFCDTLYIFYFKTAVLLAWLSAYKYLILFKNHNYPTYILLQVRETTLYLYSEGTRFVSRSGCWLAPRPLPCSICLSRRIPEYFQTDLDRLIYSWNGTETGIEDSRIQRCYGMPTGKQLPMFRRSLLPLSSGSISLLRPLHCLNPNMETIWTSETWVNTTWNGVISRETWKFINTAVKI